MAPVVDALEPEAEPAERGRSRKSPSPPWAAHIRLCRAKELARLRRSEEESRPAPPHVIRRSHVLESLEEFRVRFRAEVRADKEANLVAKIQKDKALKKIRGKVDDLRDIEVKERLARCAAASRAGKRLEDMEWDLDWDLEQWYASHPDREESLREHMTRCIYEQIQIEKDEESKKRRTT